MLIEKAWAKIKGSYGAISAGCPHEVLNAFSLAPCYFYQIESGFAANLYGMPFKAALDKFKKLKAFL